MKLEIQTEYGSKLEKFLMIIFTIIFQLLFIVAITSFFWISSPENEKKVPAITMGYLWFSYMSFSYYFKTLTMFKLTVNGLEMQRGVFAKACYHYSFDELLSMDGTALGISYGPSLLTIKTKHKKHYIVLSHRSMTVTTDALIAPEQKLKLRFEAQLVAYVFQAMSRQRKLRSAE